MEFQQAGNQFMAPKLAQLRTAYAEYRWQEREEDPGNEPRSGRAAGKQKL